VLDVPSGATFSLAESTPSYILANVFSNNDLADITTGKKAARVRYTVAPDAPWWRYLLAFEPALTVFGSGDPIGALEIPVALRDTELFIPEPSGLALPGLACLLLGLRRRSNRAA